MNFRIGKILSGFVIVGLCSSLAQSQNLQSQRYPVVAMNSSYVQSDQSRHVKYLTLEERQSYQVNIREGVVYSVDGQRYPDTLNSKKRHINHINYVMDSEGHFYLFNEYAFPQIRHSSIFAGGAVAGAGEIVIKAGTITYIDSDSGHYSTKSLLANVLQELRNDGVDTAQLQMPQN